MKLLLPRWLPVILWPLIIIFVSVNSDPYKELLLFGSSLVFPLKP